MKVNIGDRLTLREDYLQYDKGTVMISLEGSLDVGEEHFLICATEGLKTRLIVPVKYFEGVVCTNNQKQSMM